MGFAESMPPVSLARTAHFSRLLHIASLRTSIFRDTQKQYDFLRLARFRDGRAVFICSAGSENAPVPSHFFASPIGTYGVDKMPGALIRILFQPQTHVSAQVCEHPRSGGWTEFATRYTDGSSDYLTTLPDQGIAPPPFVRTSRADKSTPMDRLYQQHLAQRKSGGIKPVAASEVVHEMEDAYMRYTVWKNNKGLTPEEVAHVTVKWAKAKQQAAGQS